MKKFTINMPINVGKKLKANLIKLHSQFCDGVKKNPIVLFSIIFLNFTFD